MKREYLAAIEAAGFERIEVLGEDTYPIEPAASDPTAQAIRSDLSMSSEALNDLATSVASIKVFASKPA